MAPALHLVAWLKPVLSRPGLNGFGVGEAKVSRGEDNETDMTHATFRAELGTHQTQARWAKFFITVMPGSVQVWIPLPSWSPLDCRVVPSPSRDSVETYVVHIGLVVLWSQWSFGNPVFDLVGVRWQTANGGHCRKLPALW